MLFNAILVRVRRVKTGSYVQNNFVSESVSQLGYYMVETYRRSAVQIFTSSSQVSGHKN